MVNGFELRALRKAGFEGAAATLEDQANRLAVLEGRHPQTSEDFTAAFNAAIIILRMDLKRDFGIDLDERQAYTLATRVCSAFRNPEKGPEDLAAWRTS